MAATGVRRCDSRPSDACRARWRPIVYMTLIAALSEATTTLRPAACHDDDADDVHRDGAAGVRGLLAQRGRRLEAGEGGSAAMTATSSATRSRSTEAEVVMPR